MAIGHGEQRDFFISRRGASAAVAQEVAQTLIDAGYACIVQDFDARADEVIE